MKKLLTYSLVITLFVLTLGLSLTASTQMVPLRNARGTGYVTHRGTTTQVMIPESYTQQDTEFRAVWVSPLVNDIGTFFNEDVYKNELLGVLDTMETYKLNAIVFHLRIMNDALYDSDLNPKSNYITGANFAEWDYLEWFIGEAHRRGIEFHAWLNPYRINNKATNMADVLSKYQAYPQNPASKEENVLLGESGAILNPGEPAVRDFVIQSCMEIIERYNVDAIHFDDYFYAKMDNTRDDATYNKYKHLSKTTNKYDWRREQIDLFIEQLSTTMRTYNQENNRHVQLGIAPTGIYRNGNGVVTYDSNGTAITSGSNTAGQEHYASYLYCDTKKWVDNEWIDYITPQTYWSFELTAAPYADVVDWWAQVVRHKDVNLYTGMGLYRKYSGDAGASWETNPYEASNQLLYNTKHDTIKGVIIFNFRYLRQALANEGIQRILTDYWVAPAITPQIKTMNPVVPQKVGQVEMGKDDSQYVLLFDASVSATKYAVYRSNGTVNLQDPTQVISIVGANADGKVIVQDKVSTANEYNYAIVPISATGTRGQASYIHTSEASESIDLEIGTMANARVGGVILPGRKAEIRFDKAEVTIGTDLTYELAYSYNGRDWVVVPQSQLRSIGNGFFYEVLLPMDAKPLFVKVTGRNSLGKITSEITKANVAVGSTLDLLEISKQVLEYKINRFWN